VLPRWAGDLWVLLIHKRCGHPSFFYSTRASSAVSSVTDGSLGFEPRAAALIVAALAVSLTAGSLCYAMSSPFSSRLMHFSRPLSQPRRSLADISFCFNPNIGPERFFFSVMSAHTYRQHRLALPLSFCCFSHKDLPQPVLQPSLSGKIGYSEGLCLPPGPLPPFDRPVYRSSWIGGNLCIVVFSGSALVCSSCLRSLSWTGCPDARSRAHLC